VSAVEDQATALRAEYPDWKIWGVQHFLDGGVTWCARRYDEPDLRNTIRTDRIEQLAVYLEQAEANAEGVILHTESESMHFDRLLTEWGAWRITRNIPLVIPEPGFTAVERATGRRIIAANLTELESALRASKADAEPT
jgi:hypothetical protein